MGLSTLKVFWKIANYFTATWLSLDVSFVEFEVAQIGLFQVICPASNSAISGVITCRFRNNFEHVLCRPSAQSTINIQSENQSLLQDLLTSVQLPPSHCVHAGI